MTPEHPGTPGNRGTQGIRRVLVTGGDGLIGRAVVEHLTGKGLEVTILSVPGPVTQTETARCARYITGSVTDPDTVHKAVSGQDAVIHLAGLAGLDRGTPADIYATNAVGTFLVLDAAGREGVRKVVYASSINAFGLPLNPHPVLPSRYPWDEDEPAVIADAYSLSKQANEHAAEATARRYGIELTGIRFPLVRDIYEQNGTVFAQHIRLAMNDDPRRQACEGWTYLDVRDAAASVEAALQRNTPPAPGILVAAPTTYLRQPTTEALNRYAPAVPRESIPGRDVPVSLRRASELLGFKAEHILEQISEDHLVDLKDLDL